MSEELKGLLELMSLERLENNLFRGQSTAIHSKRVFGGQVLGPRHDARRRAGGVSA